MNADEKAIATVLGDYEGALNRSDTAAVMKLYAPDGVFMPQHFPSSVGANAVRKAYDGVFRTITLNVKFAVAEIKQVGPDWAFARTNSAGTVKINATGQSSPEANQELFVFQKVGDDWRIARYCFSTTNPPRA
ncbi:MAG TPA: SgcJ/EcaC family oxidoreductase [Terriglobales bacterium]|nr:SgcJ/EcaC family oxidoreductase [Terriglobales bacterium]